MSAVPKPNGKVRICADLLHSITALKKKKSTTGCGWHSGMTRRYSSVSQIRYDIRILADTICEESAPLTTLITLFNRCAWGIFRLDFLQLQNTFSWGFPTSLQTQEACRQHSRVWKVLQKFENADLHSMSNVNSLSKEWSQHCWKASSLGLGFLKYWEYFTGCFIGVCRRLR